MQDAHLHLKAYAARDVVDVRVATNQCQSRLLGQIVDDGVIVEDNEVAANVLEIIGNVELHADASPVRVQSVVVS